MVPYKVVSKSIFGQKWATWCQPRLFYAELTCSRAACTLQVHPLPPFPLMQHLSPKDIAGNDIMKLSLVPYEVIGQEKVVHLVIMHIFSSCGDMH